MRKEVGIIDYGRGNLRSVAKALEAVGAKVKIGSKPSDLEGCAGILLPGVGAFADAMGALKRQGFVPAIQRWAKEGRPMLGVCLGLQLFCESSTEFGLHKGLSLFKAKVSRFRAGLKVPHMGWNQVQADPQCPLFKGLKPGSEFYFVHSYRAGTVAGSAGRTRYGRELFASALWKDKVFAVQFHPEKSQRAGLKLYANYWKLVRSAAS
jgi:glutamine amidotransferase